METVTYHSLAIDVRMFEWLENWVTMAEGYLLPKPPDGMVEWLQEVQVILKTEAAKHKGSEE